MRRLSMQSVAMTGYPDDGALDQWGDAEEMGGGQYRVCSICVERILEYNRYH